MNLRGPSLRAILACGSVLLAACGGGGGSGSEAPVDFGTADAAATALISSYVDINGDPVSGLVRSSSFMETQSVTYDGAIRGALGGNTVVGDLALTVAFGTGDIAGTARNFQNEVTGPYTGTLSGTGNVDEGADPGLPQMTLVLQGNLGGGPTSALLLDGDFFEHGGAPEGAVAGIVDGTIGGVVLDDAIFAAEN